MTSEDAAPAYVPALPPADIERIRQWHERAYASIATRGEQTLDYLGLTLVVPPGVMPITPTSHLLGQYYSPGLLHGDPPFFWRWSGDAGGLELGVVVVPSGAGLVASSPS